MRIEENIKEKNFIEIQEDIKIEQEDGTVIVLEAGDRISIVETENKEEE